MCIIFSIWGKCKLCLVLECSYVIYNIYAVYFAREKTLGNRRCLFKKCFEPSVLLFVFN